MSKSSSSRRKVKSARGEFRAVRLDEHMNPQLSHSTITSPNPSALPSYLSLLIFNFVNRN